MTLRRLPLLMLCIVVSLALHASLLYFAPQLKLLQASSETPDVLRRFEVDLAVLSRPDVTFTQEDMRTEAESVENIREHVTVDEMAPPDIEPSPPAELGELDGAVAEWVEPDMLPEQPPAEVLARMDAKILEITRDEAREDIDIDRWEVRPSTARVVRDGEYPALRAPADAMRDEVLLIDPLSPGTADTPMESATPPPGDTPAEGPAPPDPGLPQLPVEEIIARQPVIADIEEERNVEYMNDMVAVQLAIYEPPDDSAGYFRLRVVPRQDKSIEPLPKDITFVVDGSSSILQRKLDLISRGLRDAVDRLRPEDRFNAVIFRDTPQPFRPESVYATAENKAQFKEFIASLESRGETDVYNALQPVIQTPPKTEGPGIIVVMTDGRPTTGIKDGRAIINGLTEQSAAGNSVFAFSAGRTIDRYLLDLLSYRNKGESVIPPDIEDMDEALPALVAELSDPLLVNVRADFGAIDAEEVYPKRTPDFYKSRALTVYGRYDPQNEDGVALRMTGEAHDGRKEIVFRADLTEAERGGEDIARGWAFSKIYYLISEISRVGETPELLRQVRELSRRYGIRTSYDE